RRALGRCPGDAPAPRDRARPARARTPADCARRRLPAYRGLAMRLRDYTPRGYNARHILILIVPMIVFVVAMTLFFFNTHVEQVNTKLSRSFAQELQLAVERRTSSSASWPDFVNS